MRALLCFAVLALGCTPARGSEPMPRSANTHAQAKAESTITADGLLRHITTLSSDRFAGRAPGTDGEALTVDYIQAEMQRAGLAPGNPDGSWVQTVPLAAITSTATLAFDGKPLVPTDQFVAWSFGTAPKAEVTNRDVVFVGYGIVAPERERDDYKDVDVRGKTVIILVGDPFGGPKLTYFGRWTYKFEQAAKKGAAAALIVHETGPAGYGWNVVSGGGVREHYEIATDEARNAHVAVEGWIHETQARALIPDFDATKAKARTKEFRPIALGPRADIEVTSTVRNVSTRNVVGRLVGTDRKDEHVIYSAHWDHFGTTPKGVFHGALDNASGVAWLLENARAFAALGTPPRRSILFTAFTAEESGLLGAKYYCANPLYPLKQTIANINMDIMNPWGRTRAIVSLGLGQTTMDAVLAEEAARQGRRVVSDPEGEKGYYYRSDHFEFAKHGVPALGFLFPGADYVDQPPEFGDQKRRDYIANRYHSPNDVIAPDWDLRGTVEDTVLLFRVGQRVASAEGAPAWSPEAEFRSRR